MDIKDFEKIILEINKELKNSINIINSAIEKDIENGYISSFDDILKEIDIASKNIIESKLDEKKQMQLAIIYNGNIESTINIIVNSIYFDNKVDFYGIGYDITKAVIIELINQILENEFKIKNKFTIINENYNNLIIDNQEKYDKIVFIGDYFEYNNIQYRINKKIHYNSYGFLKVYMDEIKHKKEFKEMTKISYKRNISIEYYHDIDDFIQNVTENDTVIIFDDIEDISNKLKAKKIYSYKEFIDNYRFSYI